VNSRIIRGIGLSFVPFAFAGCGVKFATVTGDVKVNGVAVEKWTISFTSADGKGVQTSAEIQGGRYEIHATPGKEIVQISVPVPSGKPKINFGPGVPPGEPTAESLPNIYNTKSTLEFDVQPGGNSKDWLLDVKKPQ
jgi:hypothetical protein